MVFVNLRRRKTENKWKPKKYYSTKKEILIVKTIVRLFRLKRTTSSDKS
jgi:hypothetical protein